MIRGTRLGTLKKGSLANNTAYVNTSNYTYQAVGKAVRLGDIIRGTGLSTYASARFMNANYLLSYSSSSSAGGFQVRLPEGTVSATNENDSDVSENE